MLDTIVTADFHQAHEKNVDKISKDIYKSMAQFGG